MLTEGVDSARDKSVAMSALIVKAKCILLLSLIEKGNKSISRSLATNWVPGCRLEHSTHSNHTERNSQW